MRNLVVLSVVFVMFLCGSLVAQTYQLNGDLGIGTTPESKLDVDGDSKLRGDAEVEGELKVANLAGDAPLLDRLVFADPSGKLFKASTEDFIDQLYSKECSSYISYSGPVWSAYEGNMVLCDGFLGVGTSTPTARLDVAGSAKVAGSLSASSGTFSGSLNVTGLLTGANASFSNVNLQTAEVANLFKTHSLQVTGGNTVPRFVVYPSGYMRTNLDAGVIDAWQVKNANDEYVHVFRGNGTVISNLKGDADFAYQTTNQAGDDIFVVTSDGHVHAVEMFSNKVTVELNHFPDYVFEDSYELMPLHELKRFIETERHLPNMPTAGQVRDNGVDLGELNRLLVEKVEELTLYVLQLKSENDDLKKTIVERLEALEAGSSPMSK